MSPVPVIELQRRLTLVGAIRAGGEKGDRKPGPKLEAWRITSPRRELVEQAAGLYGGTISPWRSPVGEEWQVFTEQAEIPVLVMPGYSLRQSYELWEGATKRCGSATASTRTSPAARVSATSRASTAATCTRASSSHCPELDTVLGWRVITRGANAGHELPTMMALIEAKASGQTFVPARLRLDQRRGVKDGQVVRFVVPTIDLGASYLELASNNRRELPPGGYVPAERRDPTLEQALDTVRERPPPTGRPSGREAAPIGPAYDDFDAEPVPVADPPTAVEREPKPSEGQRRRLHAEFRRRSLDRDARLAWVGHFLGREITSFNELTASEHSRVLERLAADDIPYGAPEQDEPPAEPAANEGEPAEASEPVTLSLAMFKARLAGERFGRDLVAEVGRELYTGRSLEQLTDEERATLMETLLERRGEVDW